MISTNRKKTLIMALYAGEIMLKNGAETYRVEDTITRLCKSRNFQYVEPYVTPTGIFVSVDTKGESQDEIVTYIKRIKSRKINLNKVAEVNNFSRNFVDSNMDLKEAMTMLKNIDKLKCFSKHIDAFLGGGVASGFFALLFGGDMPAFLGAFVIGSIVSYILTYLNSMEFPPFLSNICGGAVAAGLAILISYITPLMNITLDVDKVITGSIMVMVPGVAITNAVRDSIAGDLVAGLARAVEAVIIATSIAVGVGFILTLWQIMLGGSLS